MSIYGSLLESNSIFTSDLKIDNIPVTINPNAYRKADFDKVVEMLALDFPAMKKNLSNHVKTDLIGWICKNIKDIDPDDLYKELKLTEVTYKYFLYKSKSIKEYHGMFEFTYEISKGSSLYEKVEPVVLAVEVFDHKTTKLESCYPLY